MASPSIEGLVRSPTGDAVAGARVVVQPELLTAFESPVTASTDRDGRFQVPLAAAGAYLVCVDAAGWAPFVAIHARTGRPLIVTLQRGRSIVGTVRDGLSSRPLAGASVEAFAFASPLPNRPAAGRRESSTDAAGRYRLDGLPETTVTVAAVARGFARQSAAVRAGSTQVDWSLQPGAWLSGTVQGSTGSALRGAVVTATAIDGPHQGGYGRAISDARGRFEILGLDAGLFRVGAYRPGLAPALAGPLRVDSHASLSLSLGPGAVAVGRLVDTDGRGLAGQVIVESIDGGFAAPFGEAFQPKTSADGRFRLGDLPAGVHRARLAAPAHATRSLEFATRADGQTDLGELSLETGALLRGRLLEATGAAVAGARVQAVSVDGRGGFGFTSTDERGGFVLAGLAEGRYRVSAFVEGVCRASRETEAGSEAFDWTLEATGALAGRVVDGSGQPVDSCDVVAHRLGDGEGGGSSARCSPEGAFRIDGVPPGRYALEVRAPEHADAVVADLTVTPERVTEVGRVQLGPAGTVRGRVVDAAGRPQAGVALRVRSHREVAKGDLSDTPSTHTTSDGRFEVRGLNPGTVDVEATHPRLGRARAAVEVDPEAGPAEVALTLVPGGGVQGRILLRGQPLPAVVTAVAFSGPASASAATDESGTFRLENLPAGPAWLSFRPLADARETLPDKRVVVREGETVTLDLDLHEITVSGRVTRSGLPAGGLRVVVDQEGQRITRTLREDAAEQTMIAATAADGEYALRVLEPGPYTVRVEAADLRVLYSRAVTVPDVESYRLDLDFISSAVRGTLLDEATGQPLGEGEVVALDEHGDARAEARSGGDGRFELPLEPGRYQLLARSSGYTAARQALELGPQPTELELRLQRGWRLRGGVVDARGQPVAALPVFAVADGNLESLSHAETAVDGSFELGGLGEPRYNLLAGSALVGFASAAAVGPQAGELQLRLRPAGRVRVSVRDAAGLPVPGAFLVVVGLDGATVFSFSGFEAADADGVVDLAVPVGTVELMANDERGRRSGVTTVSVGPDEMAVATVSVSSRNR